MSRFFCIAAVAILMNAPAALLAQGGYAGAFLRAGVGARSDAMGRAYAAMVEGNESAFYNPAATAWFNNREFMAAYRAMSLDRTLAFISFGSPVRPKPDSTGKTMNGGLSLSWVHAGIDNIDARDFDGARQDPLSNTEDAVSLSFSLQPHRLASIGITARLVSNHLAGVAQDGGGISASAFGFDFGALVEPMPGVRLAAVLTNLNLKYTWNTEGVYERATSRTDQFPKAFRLGVAITRLARWLTVTGDVEKRDFSDATIHLGGLASLRQGIAVRGGLNDGQPAMGAGYNFGLLGSRSELHYAFVTHRDGLDNDHVFEWVFIF